MSLMMMLALGGKVPVTETFTANATWVAPVGVTSIDVASGYGARGTDAGSTVVQQYSVTQTTTFYRRDGGPADTVTDGTTNGIPGATPSNYCEGIEGMPDNTTYYGRQRCFSYSNTSYNQSTPATTGASATGVGKTFPGSTGNVAQTTTTFTNVTVVPGQSYPLVVPTGGRIQISYLR